MRADWYLTIHATRCGLCGETIPSHAPARRRRSGGIRCAGCALRSLGEEVPADLLPASGLPANLPIHATVTPFPVLVEVRRRTPATYGACMAPDCLARVEYVQPLTGSRLIAITVPVDVVREYRDGRGTVTVLPASAIHVNTCPAARKP